VLSPAEAANYNRKLSGVSGDAILRFGLVEGTAIVSGKRVVYDPQSASPVPFNENGSTADELALILNRNEAEQLAGEDDLESIFTELMAGTTAADVVVLKRGAKGAIVRTSGITTKIPVFRRSLCGESEVEMCSVRSLLGSGQKTVKMPQTLH